MLNLAIFFAEQDWESVLLTKTVYADEYDVPPIVRRIPYDVPKEMVTTSRIKNIRNRMKNLKRIFKEEQPEVIISFLCSNNKMAIRAARSVGIPVIVSERSNPATEYTNVISKLIVNYIYRYANGVVFQTPDAKAFFGNKVQKKSVILPNSIQKDFVRIDYFKDRNNAIVTVGRMDDNKNQIMLIKAFEKIADYYPQIVLKLYGEGVCWDEWKAYAEQSPYANRIQFYGRISDVDKVIDKDRIFVLPSKNEGIPNSLIEAMALGLAVVATDCPCGGVRALLEDNKNGLLVPVNDVDSMADAIRKILDNPTLEEQLRANAFAKTKEYLPEKVNAMWLDYVECIIKENAR